MIYYVQKGGTEMNLVQELTLAMQETEDAYNALYELTYCKPFPTDYERHQVGKAIRYAEEQEFQIFEAFCLCYF